MGLWLWSGAVQLALISVLPAVSAGAPGASGTSKGSGAPVPLADQQHAPSALRALSCTSYTCSALRPSMVALRSVLTVSGCHLDHGISAPAGSKMRTV